MRTIFAVPILATPAAADQFAVAAVLAAREGHVGTAPCDIDSNRARRQRLKGIWVASCTAFVLTVLASSTAWASAFSILDIQYRVWTDVGSQVGGPEYDVISGSPLFVRLDFPEDPDSPPVHPYTQAVAIGSYVGIEVQEAFFGTPLEVGAESTITFAPTFDGIAPDIRMYSLFAFDVHSGWSITDLTTSSLVSLDVFGVGPTPGSALLRYGTYGSSTEYVWDSTHMYELELWARGGGNRGYRETFLTTDMFAVPEYTSTVRLLACGLMALVWGRRRWPTARSRNCR